MASQVRSAGTGVERTDGPGTVEWGSETNVVASDNLRANASKLANTGDASTEYLQGKSFGFTIPSGSTITGITSRFERQKLGTGGSVTGDAWRLTDDTGAVRTHDKTAQDGAWGTETYAISGSSQTDLWGEVAGFWTAEKVNDADFGFVVSASIGTTGAGSTIQAQVDHMELTVYYTEPPPTAGWGEIPIR